MWIYINLNDICTIIDDLYDVAIPLYEKINYINKLNDDGNNIIINTKYNINVIKDKLNEWNVKYNDVVLIKEKKESVEIVEKGWGKEIIFVNNSEYCGKILVFNKDKRFSMHYHIQKKETWYVSKGKFILIWIDTENGTTYTDYLSVGDVITNERGSPHQLLALEDSEIFEVSTKHYDNDSYRIKKGD